MMRNADQDRAAYNWPAPSEVAADPRLHASTKHVHRLIAAGELEAMDISQPGSKRPTYRINPASVERFIASRTKKAA